MDIVVKSRHTEVADRFRDHVADKLGRVERLDGRVSRIDVEICEEHNPRLAAQRARIELTCRTRGPVVRAEAAAPDPYAALDVAVSRLESRLRRAADRRRVHHGHRTPVSVAAATARLAAAPVPPPAGAPDDEPPVFVVRRKEHVATAMTVEQALHEMELVGHDFFLYVDAATGRPSVVYRRKGYDYGVIALVEGHDGVARLDG